MTNYSRLYRLTAEKLLRISAIKLQPTMPFTLSTGWSSPIYTDSSKVLSYPDVRSLVKIEMSRLILEEFDNFDAIAAVSTGAIAIGALVADELNLPYAYVRNTPKDHGLENIIEGNLKPGQRVLMIEDLVTTGKSALKAFEAITAVGCTPVGLASVFSLQLPMALDKQSIAGIKTVTLSNYSAMIEVALEKKLISESDVTILNQWHADPENWTPA